jgi:hypothetical protein
MSSYKKTPPPEAKTPEKTAGSPAALNSYPRRPESGQRSMMVLLVGVVLLEMIESSGHAGNADEEEKEVHVVS